MTSAECQISDPKGRYLVFTLLFFQMPMMKTQDLNTKIITKKPKSARNCESRASIRRRSLQLLVLRLGFLQDGDVGVGVFPEGEEVLVSSLAFGCVAGKGVGTGQAEMRKSAQREV